MITLLSLLIFASISDKNQQHADFKTLEKRCQTIEGDESHHREEFILRSAYVNLLRRFVAFNFVVHVRNILAVS